MSEKVNSGENICHFIKQFKKKIGTSSDFFPDGNPSPDMELDGETFPRYSFSNDSNSSVHEFTVTNKKALAWIDNWCAQNKTTALLMWQESAASPMEKLAFYFEGEKKSSSPMGELESPEGLTSDEYSSVLIEREDSQADLNN